MSIINPVNVLDGNPYLVAGNNDAGTVSSDFDNIYNQQSEDMTLDEIFSRVAEEYGVDVSLLKAVAQAESAFDTNAVSGCGAMGIMQLMPATAESLGVKDPFDAQQNITGGAKMLAYLLDDYNGNVTLALAAYNAGSGSVQKYGGVPPYQETMNYIRKINDILGGALEQDSTTVEGAAATDLSGASSAEVPDVLVRGTSWSETFQDYSYTAGRLQTDTAGLQHNYEYTSDETLLNSEDYEHFRQTCERTLDRLVETAAEDVGKNVSAAYAGQPQGAQHLLQESGQPAVAEWQPAAAVFGMQTVEHIMRSSPQSLYEAQASVISPVLAQMREQS